MKYGMKNITYEEYIQNILNARGRFGCGSEYHEMSDEDFFAMVKEKTKDWWIKAILVYIETPD